MITKTYQLHRQSIEEDVKHQLNITINLFMNYNFSVLLRILFNSCHSSYPSLEGIKIMYLEKYELCF